MPDLMDHAQELELHRSEQINALRDAPAAPSEPLCWTCGDDIPEARQLAVPGVRYCVHCAEATERANRHGMRTR